MSSREARKKADPQERLQAYEKAHEAGRQLSDASRARYEFALSAMGSKAYNLCTELAQSLYGQAARIIKAAATTIRDYYTRVANQKVTEAVENLRREADQRPRADSRTAVPRLNEKIAELETRIKTHNRHLSDLQHANIAYRNLAEQEKRRLEAQLGEKDETISQLHGDLQKLHDQVELLEGQLNDLQLQTKEAKDQRLHAQATLAKAKIKPGRGPARQAPSSCGPGHRLHCPTCLG